MARSKNDAGDLILSKIQAAAAGAGIAAGTPVTNSQLAQVWRAVADGLFTHDAAQADLAPGAFQVSVTSFGTWPVTGIGGHIT